MPPGESSAAGPKENAHQEDLGDRGTGLLGSENPNGSQREKRQSLRQQPSQPRPVLSHTPAKTEKARAQELPCCSRRNPLLLPPNLEGNGDAPKVARLPSQPGAIPRYRVCDTFRRKRYNPKGPRQRR